MLDENGNVIRTIDPVRIKQTVSEETSAQIRSYLYDTVSEGTGRYAKVAGYSMGGKTGTAQKSVSGAKDEKNYLVSFIGYLPADDPQLVIYAVVDEPNTHDQAHSTYAQNIVREILEEALPYLNIYQDETPAEGALTPEETNFYTGLNGVSVPATTAEPQEEQPAESDSAESADTPDEPQEDENTPDEPVEGAESQPGEELGEPQQ